MRAALSPTQEAAEAEEEARAQAVLAALEQGHAEGERSQAAAVAQLTDDLSAAREARVAAAEQLEGELSALRDAHRSELAVETARAADALRAAEARGTQSPSR